MVYDVSTILSLPDDDFSAFLKSYLEEARISGNALGKEIMGKSKNQGHKYIRGPLKLETRKELITKLGEENVVTHYRKINPEPLQEHEGGNEALFFDNQTIKDIFRTYPELKYAMMFAEDKNDGELHRVIGTWAKKINTPMEEQTKATTGNLQKKLSNRT